MKLQVALDLVDIEEAVEIAKKSVSGGVDWIEAGTPLIKNEGMEVVKVLKNTFPDKVIVADLKTMDTGFLEVELAAKKGAYVVSILGIADDATVKGAVEAGDKYHVDIMADLIGVDNLGDRAKQLEGLGVDYALVHTGIDQQKKGQSPLDSLEEVSDKINIPFAVAGGLGKGSIGEVKEMGAEVAIVGSSITSADDPKEACEELKLEC